MQAWINRKNKLTWAIIAGSLTLLISAFILWWISLRHINPHNMTELGLVSTLPLTFFIALGLLNISFCITLHFRPNLSLLLLLHIVLLIMIFHGTPIFTYETLRNWTVFRHVGITDYIMSHGSLLDLHMARVENVLNIQYQWPGFFALSALFTHLAGYDSAMKFAAWGPVFFNILYCLALVFVFRVLTNNSRLIWLSAWLFFATSWIQQDYFAPQAFGFFFYLVIIGMCLRWFLQGWGVVKHPYRSWLFLNPISTFVDFNELHKPAKAGRVRLPWAGFALSVAAVSTAEGSVTKNCQGGRFFNKVFNDPKVVDDQSLSKHNDTAPLPLLKIFVILFFAVVVSAHQLTQVVLITVIILLVIFSRISTRTLPILMLVMVTTWLIYMGAYFFENSDVWYRSFLQILENFLASLRLDLDSERTKGIVIGYVFSAIVWLLAAIGAGVRYKRGHRDITLMLLAIAPLSLLLVMSYGGELFLRVYFFSLPWGAFLIASIFYPQSSSQDSSWKIPASFSLISYVLLIGLVLSYYSNESVFFYTRNEVEAVRYLEQSAQPGSRVLIETVNVPRTFTSNTPPLYIFLSRRQSTRDTYLNETDIRHLIDLLGEEEKYTNTFLLLSRGQEKYSDHYNVFPKGALSLLREQLKANEGIEVYYENPDAVIFRRKGQ